MCLVHGLPPFVCRSAESSVKNDPGNSVSSGGKAGRGQDLEPCCIRVFLTMSVALRHRCCLGTFKTMRAPPPPQHKHNLTPLHFYFHLALKIERCEQPSCSRAFLFGAGRGGVPRCGVLGFSYVSKNVWHLPNVNLKKLHISVWTDVNVTHS